MANDSLANVYWRNSMGMYNEVFKSCPKCGKTCETQIPQVVLGFGGFNLDNPNCSGLKELTVRQKRELAEYVGDSTFHCQGGNRGHVGCGHSFQVEVEVSQGNNKVVI